MIIYYLLMARYRAETNAEVAELADALDSKSSVVTLRAGSSPAFGTSKFKPQEDFLLGLFCVSYQKEMRFGHILGTTPL